MSAGIDPIRYAIAARECLNLALAQAFSDRKAAIITGAGACIPGADGNGQYEVTVLVLCEEASKRLGERAGEALDKITTGEGHGPYRAVVRD